MMLLMAIIHQALGFQQLVKLSGTLANKCTCHELDRQ